MKTLMLNLAVVLVMLLPVSVLGQQVTGDKQSAQAHSVATQRDASCRISSGEGAGSGTCIAKKRIITKNLNTKYVGVVLTCAHVLDYKTGSDIHKEKVTLTFRNDGDAERAGTVLAVDWNNDLATIAVYVHKDQPVIPIASKPLVPGEAATCYVYGYGPDGEFQRFTGTAMGYTSFSWPGTSAQKNVPAREGDRHTSSGRNQIYVAAVGLRKGDSGGGIINKRGELAGVFWGGTGTKAYGTYSGSIESFLGNSTPTNFRWVRDKRFRRNTVVTTTRPRTTTPPPIVDPNTVPVPVAPKDDDDSKVPPAPMVEPPPVVEMEDPEPGEDALAQLARLEKKVDALLQGQETLANAASMTNSNVGQVNAGMAALQAKLAEAKPHEITLKVESSKFISPSYVDVSVLWALQQKSGIDHMVLITDTSADHWTTRMSGEYDAAKAKFPAIVLYDVASKGVAFKELPQLVIYPVKPGKDPVIVKGTDLVAKQLQGIVRGELPSGFQEN